MRQCPSCSLLLVDEVETCPRDGAKLPPPVPLLGSVVANRYRVEALLGRGGQGSVYRAQHLQLQRPVALKVLRPEATADDEAVERFNREALTAAKLKHPHVVTIYDFDVAEGVGAFLVMELLEGRTLREEIDQSGRLPVSLALSIAREVCAGLEAAHLEQVLHRDVKPDNIYLDMRRDGTVSVKLLDFGISKLFGIAAPGAITSAGVVYGTPHYMSPEQCRDDPLDARSDVYSLGCVLFEMLTGSTPFPPGNGVSVLFKHCFDAPPAPSSFVPELPAALDGIILRALAKRPDARFQTAGEFRAALESIDLSAPSSDEDLTVGGAPVAAESYTTARGAVSAELAPRATSYGASLPPHNLPEQLTSFVGREAQIADLRALVSAHRLLTLTGPSGRGKTRLSVRTAFELMPDFPDGVWFVELAAISDPALVPHALASAIEVREVAGRSLTDVVKESLRAKRTLVVLDNCEHLVAACAALAGGLLRVCPELHLLATSQEALNIQGETTWIVPMLSVPGPDASLDEIGQSEAVRLFAERARQSSPRFALTEQNAAAVNQICRQLDGIPLAIELAAARVRMLPAEQIAARLDDRFRLLTSGDRTAEPRRRTLQAAMDWSYDLLGENERRFFERLAVFAGGFTIEATEAVCSGDPIDRYEAFDLLAHLVDKSLVTMLDTGGAARYRMLGTVRQYALERLHASGEVAPTRASHMEYFLGLAEALEEGLKGPGLAASLDTFEAEHDNFRAALEWGRVESDESQDLVRLAGTLSKFWEIRGHIREGLVWLESALARAEGASPEARAKALHGAGALARLRGDDDKAVAYLEQSLALRRQMSDLRAMASTLNNLGFVAQWQGDYERAAALHDEGLALAREIGDDWEVASALNNLGVIARYRGESDRAMRLFEESSKLFAATGDERELANTLSNFGVVVATSGDFERAATIFEETLALRRSLGDQIGIATSLNNMGEVAHLQGDYAKAVRYLKESLKLHEKIGDTRGLAYSLESFIGLAVGQELVEQALRLAGATAALRERIGSPLSPAEQADLDAQVGAARAALGEERTEVELARGRAMTVQQAIDYALRLPTNPLA